jgi:pimeloyl-ACP methyl ester carboxylesterase
MNAPLAKFIDWLRIQKRCRRRPSIDRRTLRLQEALQFLMGPDFIPAESEPARVEFSPSPSGLHFRFPTPRPCGVAENNIVYGRFYRCAGRWQERPMVVLLHGGNAGAGNAGSLGYRFGFALIARRCNRAGFNAATLEAPYHFQRYPRQAGIVSPVDYLRMAQAVAQAASEIRALTGWLLAEGCPAVALWGLSMGGWLAGMTVCREARLAAVVMTLPVVRSNPSCADRIIWRDVREAWQGLRWAEERLDTTPFNLTTARPAIPKKNILLVEGTQDLLTPPEPIEELWQLWGQPDIWRLPHGHMSLSLSLGGLTGPVLRWLAPRLDKPAIEKPPNGAAQSVERMGASRSGQFQCLRQWRLAPTAHARRWPMYVHAHL